MSSRFGVARDCSTFKSGELLLLRGFRDILSSRGIAENYNGEMKIALITDYEEFIIPESERDVYRMLYPKWAHLI